MQISVTIPDDKLQLVINAVCDKYGYQDGEETKAQFTKRVMLVEPLKAIVREYEMKLAYSNFTPTTTEVNIQ